MNKKARLFIKWQAFSGIFIILAILTFYRWDDTVNEFENR